MKDHEFTLILLDAPDDDGAERLYGVFDDGTISTTAGVTSISFHRQGGSLEKAMRSAIADVQSCGCVVQRVELEPKTLAHIA